ncbi:hypothetical protein OGAPHI_007374 [Ogataea philodendri]|uniref:Essential protein Yae1 N-terminal domain-containing protein n=1 Tax=Ogataea philodendri TaxID=1378263 RepID=A0A9P8SZJ6_9ASCO|nr:uncharacterized protein OGAPHI_007374 [Ogataea philodendri]KAH3660169.1 hypothetical protein OGAPHI_007374 [Ogataea philodendri]
MPSEQKDIDFDSVLNLESQYYHEGFLEGQLEGAKQQFVEGKQLGIQTGFQRFLVIGYYKKLVALWITQTKQKLQQGVTTDDSGKPRDYEKILKSLTDLQMLIDTLFENGLARTTNSDMDIQTYESVSKRVRAKLRSLLPIFNQNYNAIEDLSLKIGGSVQTEQQDEW